MEKQMTGPEVEAAVALMDEEQRDQLKMVIATLIECYLTDHKHALLLVGDDKEDALKVVAINATDMEAANLLQAVDCYLNFRLLGEAPPKEMMN